MKFSVISMIYYLVLAVCRIQAILSRMVRPLICALCSTIMEVKLEYSVSLMNLNVFQLDGTFFQYCKILDLHLNVSV